MRTAFPLLILLVLAIAGLSSLLVEPPDEPLPEHYQSYANPPFENQTGSSGLDSAGPLMTLAAADFDRDGFTDLAVSTGLDLHLYRNLSGGRFERVSGIGYGDGGDLSRRRIRGLSWLDLNRDRWPDLYLSGEGDGAGRSRVFINNGGTLVAAQLDAYGAGDGWSVLPVDADGDVVPDRLVLAEERHALVVNDVGVEIAGQLGAGARSGFPLASNEGGSRVGLYPNTEASLGIFTLSNDAGLVAVDGYSLAIPTTGPIAGQSPKPELRGVAVGDVNGDGLEDLYLAAGAAPVSGARDREDMLFFHYRRSGGLRFAARGELRLLVWSDRAATRRILVGGEEVARTRLVIDAEDPSLQTPIPRPAAPGVHLSRSGEEIVVLVVTDGPDNVVNGRLLSPGGSPRLIASSPPLADPWTLPCGQLLIAQGQTLTPSGGPSIDCGDAADATFGDFDNDGDLDLFVLKAGWPLSRPVSALYRNDGSGGFSPWVVPDLPSAAADPQAAVLAMDIDKDGRLDLLVAAGRSPVDGNLGEGVTLWRNTLEGGNWLIVELDPDSGDPFALGAEVTVHAPDLKQVRRVGPGDAPRSASLLPLHFGLGAANRAVITVRWPSGASRRVEARANRRVRITESPQNLGGTGQGG